MLRSRYVCQWSIACLVLAGTPWIAGCGDSPEDQEAPPVRAAGDIDAAAATDSAASDPTEASGAERQAFDGMSFIIPESWEKQQLSQMQMGIIAARFGMPDVDADVTVTLSVSGGGRDSNVDRWKGQFSGGAEAVEETLATAAGDADLIRLSGRFSPGFGRPAQDDWSMLGLIIPFEPQHYFIKLTGPSAAVASVEEDFIAFCRTAKPE